MSPLGAGNLVDRAIDRGVARAAQLVSAIGRPTPTAVALAGLRAEAARRVLRAHEPALRALAPTFAREARGDSPEITTAKNELARIAADALAEMRRTVEREARGIASPMSALDRLWRETSTVELIDRADFDEGDRVRLMTHLDEMNVTLGAYASFLDVLRPHLVAGRPTRILDLAAGHGGFLLEVAHLAAAQGLALELVASDIADEYLEIGRRHAAARGLPVRFVVQDALDTTNLEEGAYDLVVCTQSLHHFPPGLVAVLAHEALRIASRAVILIDGARSKLHAALVPLLGVVRYRDLPFAHDTWVSLRKFFAPEELGLLAQCAALTAPGSPVVTARFLAPGHLSAVLRP